MNPVDWQTPLTVLLAAGGAVYLLYSWLRPLYSRRAGACGGGPGCATRERSDESGLVQIDGAPSPAGGEHRPG